MELTIRTVTSRPYRQHGNGRTHGGVHVYVNAGNAPAIGVGPNVFAAVADSIARVVELARDERDESDGS